jgi:hypothetical protein
MKSRRFQIGLVAIPTTIVCALLISRCTLLPAEGGKSGSTTDTSLTLTPPPAVQTVISGYPELGSWEDRLTQSADSATWRAQAYPFERTPWSVTPPSPPPTLDLSATPVPNPLASATPTFVPWPTLIPTIDPALVPDQLLKSIQIEAVDGLESHALQRITGWASGFRMSNYCDNEPYRWLDDSHLMLYPITGQQEEMWVTDLTLPVILELEGGLSWLPSADSPSPSCHQPLWSESAQRLIVTTEQEVILYQPRGTISERFSGGGLPSNLSPSGRVLLTATAWHNLANGLTTALSERRLGNRTVWTADEMRWFDCCYGYGDANTGQYRRFSLEKLDLIGRGGGDLYGRWVLNDTRIMIHWDFESDGQYGLIPLIDPVAQRYDDLRILAGLGTDQQCGFPSIAPSGLHVAAGCGIAMGYMPPNPAATYLVDLSSLVTHTVPVSYSVVGWSPEGQFLLITHGFDWATQRGRYALFSLQGDIIPIAEDEIVAPTWAPIGANLAFLRADGQAVITADLQHSTIFQVDLPSPTISVIWDRRGSQLVALAADGRLWWIPDPVVDYVEQLTPRLPSMRAVRWSPSGSHIAFVSGADIYVVAVAP